MIGAICGDIIGSRFEFDNTNGKSFRLFNRDCRFTDDSVLTCCVAAGLMKSWGKDKFETLSEVTKNTMLDIGYWYPYCGYGGRFVEWMYERPFPYNSCGNGSAMRISPVGDIARDIEEAKELSYKVTAISHDHPEGIKGAESVAVANVLAREGKNKKEIRSYIEDKYYDLSKTVKEWREENVGHGKEICQVSVPQAFVCFLEGHSYRDVIRNCVSIGGDSDTIAAIAGGIAEAYYGVPKKVQNAGMMFLDYPLKEIVERFYEFKEEYDNGQR